MLTGVRAGNTDPLLLNLRKNGVVRQCANREKAWVNAKVGLSTRLEGFRSIGDDRRATQAKGTQGEGQRKLGRTQDEDFLT